MTDTPSGTVTDTPFSVLYEDSRFVAIDKPGGYFVHRPEDGSLDRFIPPHRIVLSRLRRQIGTELFPGHRIDVATSGILVFAKDPEAAKFFSLALQEGRAEKIYLGVSRGWFLDNAWKIDIPLESDATGLKQPALTHFVKKAQTEICPGVPGDRYPTARYTLLEARPMTGRYHQIRRHLNRVAHPLIGDNDHGDSHHNRLFRERLGIKGLCLRAMELRVAIPELGLQLDIRAPLNKKWRRLEALF